MRERERERERARERERMYRHRKRNLQTHAKRGEEKDLGHAALTEGVGTGYR